jgi:hypothetical protein
VRCLAIRVTDSTALSNGSVWREIGSWRALTSWAATVIGSTVSWGSAPWPPLALDGDLEQVRGRELGARKDGDLAGVQGRHQVGADDRVDTVHDAGFDERDRATRRLLLGMLEHETHRARIDARRRDINWATPSNIAV